MTMSEINATDLQAKTAIITGSGQGVGQGIALALADNGVNIVLAGRTESKLDNTANLIRKRGVDAITVVCNVKILDDLETLVSEAHARFGGIDILVNNAQEVPLGSLLDLSDEALTLGWESGPLATHRLMKLAYPYLKKSKGSIVNLASTVVKRWDMAGYGGYAAVKQAIIMLTRAAACEWGIDGIRVNAILPHAKSPGLVRWMEANPQEAEAFQATIPLRRVGETEEDIGRFVAMLCSDSSSYVSGQCIAVDGGQASMA